VNARSNCRSPLSIVDSALKRRSLLIRADSDDTITIDAVSCVHLDEHIRYVFAELNRSLLMFEEKLDEVE